MGSWEFSSETRGTNGLDYHNSQHGGGENCVERHNLRCLLTTLMMKKCMSAHRGSPPSARFPMGAPHHRAAGVARRRRENGPRQGQAHVQPRGHPHASQTNSAIMRSHILLCSEANICASVTAAATSPWSGASTPSVGSTCTGRRAGVRAPGANCSGLSLVKWQKPREPQGPEVQCRYAPVQAALSLQRAGVGTGSG